MTGPEHYRAAERIVSYPEEQQTPVSVGMAQVHATLALAAATAMTQYGEMPVADCDAWIAAASGGIFKVTP